MFVMNNMRVLFLGICLACNVVCGQDAGFQWAIAGHSKKLSDIVELSRLSDGDCIFAGGFSSDIRFGEQALQATAIASSAVRNTACVGRIREDGSLKWLEMVGKSSKSMYVHSMQLDTEDNIWLIGLFEGKVHFINGHTDNNPNMCMWIARMNAQGQLTMAKTFPYLNSHVHSYHLLPQKNGSGCYIASNHSAGKFGDVQLPVTGEGQYGQFLGMVNQYGEPIWAKSVGGPGSKITVNDMCYDEKGNIILSGNFRYVNLKNHSISSAKDDSTKLDISQSSTNPGEAINVMISSGSVDGFVSTFSGDGELLDFKHFSSPALLSAHRIIVDNMGNKYIGFNAYKNFSIGNTEFKLDKPNSGVLVKVDRNWKVLWSHVYDKNRLLHIDDLHLSDDGSLYVALMVGEGVFKSGDVTVKTKSLWSGAVVRYNRTSGYANWADAFEVGRINSIDFENNKGFAGGWFHYDVTIGRSELSAVEHGQFNAVVIGTGIIPEDTAEVVDTLVAIVSKDSIPDIAEFDSSDIRDSRLIETQKSIEVFSSEIKILLWDDQRVDGDIVSILFNNEWILEHYVLQKKPKEITINLEKTGSNYFIMYTEDMGEIVPTTTAITIIDGHNRHTVSLRSDPDTNGAIELVLRE